MANQCLYLYICVFVCLDVRVCVCVCLDVCVCVCSHNKLKELPVEVWSLKNLRCLHLQHNQLEELCAEVAQLTDLEEMVGGRACSPWQW